MQKISIALNAVLLIAVAVLFYMVFSLKKQVAGVYGDSDTLSVAAVPLPKAEGKIMYINMDTLGAKYEYYLKIKAELEKRGKNDEAEIKGMYDGFQKLYMNYEKQAQSGAMTEEQGQMAQMDLAQKQKAIEEKEEAINRNYSKKVQESTEQYMKYLKDYLKKKSEEHKYSYVMLYAKESNLLYVNDSLDISKQVINGLNAEYRAQQKK